MDQTAGGHKIYGKKASKNYSEELLKERKLKKQLEVGHRSPLGAYQSRHLPVFALSCGVRKSLHLPSTTSMKISYTPCSQATTL